MADPTNSATRQHWVWVTGPEYYANEDGSDREDLDPAVAPDAGGWWTCHRGTREGDLILLYRTRPRSDLKYLILAESDAYSITDEEEAWERGWDYGCDYRFLYKFREPLTLEDLRSDPYLEEWGALRGNFRQRVYRISLNVWGQLAIRIVKRDPAARGPMMRGQRRGKKFIDEKAIEDKIASDPSILRPFGYRLEIVERQLVCKGHGGRIDLLGYDRRSKRYVVIELKNVRATLNTVGQIASYMGWARERISGGRVVEGLVIARGFDTRFRAAASMNKWIKSVELADLPLG